MGVYDHSVPVLNPGTGIKFKTLEDLIERYQTLEKMIERAYQQNFDAEALEEKAARILHQIEAMASALEEGGEGDEFNEPFVNLVEPAFALAYTRTMTDPYLREELLAFLERGGPTWVPPHKAVYRDGSPVPGGTPGYWEHPGLVNQLRDIVENPEADALELIRAAKEAAYAREGLKDRLKMHAALDRGRVGQVERARRFIAKHGGHLDAFQMPESVANLSTATTVGGSLALLGLVALAWTVFTDKEHPVASIPPDSSPLPEQPVAPQPPHAPPHAAPSASRYLTAPEDIGEPVWAKLGADREIAVLFPDKNTGGFAHASTASALAAAAKYGATLPTREDMIALADQAKAAGFELDPVTLPGASHELTAEGAKPGDPAMMTERWVRIHDDLIRAQLTKRGWTSGQAVANAGKVWIAGAPPGRGYLMGWRQKNGTWIQSGLSTGPGPHDDQHCDYSMLLTLVRPVAVA